MADKMGKDGEKMDRAGYLDAEFIAACETFDVAKKLEAKEAKSGENKMGRKEKRKMKLLKKKQGLIGAFCDRLAKFATEKDEFLMKAQEEFIEHVVKK